MPDWDNAYRDAAQPLFGDKPTDFVRAVAMQNEFFAASAFCLGDGDGRNGRYLAEQGLAVTAVDLSEIATAQALEKDRAAGVEVNRIVANLEAWTPAENVAWDAVFVIFLQCEAEVRNAAISRAVNHLAPGGWFVAEGFSRLRSGTATLGPKMPDLLYDLDEIRTASDSTSESLTLCEATQGVIRLSEGVRHQGYADIIRYIARKI